MDLAALLRCRPATQDRWGYRDALTRNAAERTQAADRLQSLLEQRRRIVLTGTPAELVDSTIAVQGARDTTELLDVAFTALVMGEREAMNKPDALPMPPPAPNPMPDARGRFIYSRGGQ